MMPEELVAAKSQQLHQIVDKLLGIVSVAVGVQTPIHEVESEVFQTLLQAGRATVQLLVDCLGDGDVGEEHQLPDGTSLQRSAEPQPRPYLSIFGESNIAQYVYTEREGQEIKFAAIAARLALPEGKFSYLLQDWDQKSAGRRTRRRSWTTSTAAVPSPIARRWPRWERFTASILLFALPKTCWNRCSAIRGNRDRKRHVPIPATNRCGRC